MRQRRAHGDSHERTADAVMLLKLRRILSFSSTVVQDMQSCPDHSVPAHVASLSVMCYTLLLSNPSERLNSEHWMALRRFVCGNDAASLCSGAIYSALLTSI